MLRRVTRGAKLSGVEGEPRSAPEPGLHQETSAGAQERKKLMGRAGVVAAGTLLSRVFGLLRDVVFAGFFRRPETDAFVVAFTLPNMLRQLVAEGAVQNSLLPVLNETREREGDESAKQLFRAFRGVSLVALTVLSVLGVVAAPWLVEVVASGYRASSEQFDRTVELTRWVFPYIFFMGTAALGLAALNTHRRFVVGAFSPTLLNVASIAAALTLPGPLAARGVDPVMAMALGALLGGVLQVVAQWPSLHAIGYLAWPTLSLRHPGVRRALARMVPVLFGVGVYWVDVALARRFLSELPTGSQTYFYLAQRLCDVPLGVFALAISTASLPSLSSHFARGEHGEVAATFAHGMRLAQFVALPSTVLLVVAAEPLAVALFQRGQFGADGAAATAAALMAQAAGIWTVAAVRQLVAVYYATGDTRTPVVVAALDLGVFVGLALLLRGPLGQVGISLAVTGSSFVQMLLLWARLSRKLPEVRFRHVASSLGRSLGSALVAGGAALLVTGIAAPLLEGGALSRVLPALLACVVFALTYVGMSELVGSAEWRELRRGLGRRLRRGRPAVP